MAGAGRAGGGRGGREGGRRESGATEPTKEGFVEMETGESRLFIKLSINLLCHRDGGNNFRGRREGGGNRGDRQVSFGGAQTYGKAWN